MRAVRFSFRVATAPLARPSAAVSAVCSAAVAVLSVVSGGLGLEKDGFPVMCSRTRWEYTMSAGICLGRPSAMVMR